MGVKPTRAYLLRLHVHASDFLYCGFHALVTCAALPKAIALGVGDRITS
ncbi:hypothetical protein [Nostoc sp.]